jgi:lipoprotein-anchoring transpeptidase ErfK/SrfK
VRPGSPNQQAPEPETIDNCACSAAHANIPTPTYGTPKMGGQVVLVSITQQWLWAYQDGRMVMASAVTTGMPQLPTPTGTYHISMKESNVWFYSPWPYGSPFYYTPEHVDYAMLFRSGGFYLHAAAWRHAFGPGTNVPHTDPDGTQETGSHGCVNLPVDAAGALYGWIGIGATVIIVH